jgi:hypothetical protein
VGHYLELARQAAAAQEECSEIAESQARKVDSAYPPIGRSQAFAHEPDESYGEPNPPVKERDKSDISDQSSDYRAVVEVLRNPPYWLRDSYLAGYRRGTLSLHALSAAVAATLGRSPHACTLSSVLPYQPKRSLLLSLNTGLNSAATRLQQAVAPRNKSSQQVCYIPTEGSGIPG